MRDPHVVALRYRLQTDESTSYHNPPPITREAATYSLVLSENRLTVTMKSHFPTIVLARNEVEQLLRAWEVDVALRVGPGELQFVFEDADVVDRDPPPANERVMELSAGLYAVASMSATLHVGRAKYPEPPQHFKVSPDVATMWLRYQGYRAGREPVLSMAYFCLTVVDVRSGTRKKAARDLAISYDVLRKLGELTTTRGDAAIARKVVSHTGGSKLRPSELAWIESAVKLLIQRVGQLDGGGQCPHVSMTDLPKL